MEKIKARQLLSITLTLFAVFFGAGNMIFPPAMGQQAGENYIQALAGFILTDAGIALLGMIAVVLVGTEVSDLGELVSRRFAVFLSVCIYLLIGPLFALPRTGSVSFELAVRPYLSESNVWWVSLLVTAVFFWLTYYLSGNPKKVVNVIGKYLTPILLICIVLIFLACVFMEKSPNSFSSVWKRRSSAGSIQRDSVLPGNDRRVLCTGWSGRSGICDYYHQCSAGTSGKNKEKHH